MTSTVEAVDAAMLTAVEVSYSGFITETPFDDECQLSIIASFCLSVIMTRNRSGECGLD